MICLYTIKTIYHEYINLKKQTLSLRLIPITHTKNKNSPPQLHDNVENNVENKKSHIPDKHLCKENTLKIFDHKTSSSLSQNDIITIFNLNFPSNTRSATSAKKNLKIKATQKKATSVKHNHEKKTQKKNLQIKAKEPQQKKNIPQNNKNNIKNKEIKKETKTEKKIPPSENQITTQNQHFSTPKQTFSYIPMTLNTTPSIIVTFLQTFNQTPTTTNSSEDETDFKTTNTLTNDKNNDTTGKEKDEIISNYVTRILKKIPYFIGKKTKHLIHFTINEKNDITHINYTPKPSLAFKIHIEKILKTEQIPPNLINKNLSLNII